MWNKNVLVLLSIVTWSLIAADDDVIIVQAADKPGTSISSNNGKTISDAQTGNNLVSGVLGFGLGVGGVLLAQSFLENQRCGRGKRDTVSPRFIGGAGGGLGGIGAGAFGGSKPCYPPPPLAYGPPPPPPPPLAYGPPPPYPPPAYPPYGYPTPYPPYPPYPYQAPYPPPRNNDYNAPAPGYNAPAPGYNAPAPGYNAPAPGYNAPVPNYNSPAPSYNAPVPNYNSPAPSYNNPAPNYNAPSRYEPPVYRPGGFNGRTSESEPRPGSRNVRFEDDERPSTRSLLGGGEESADEHAKP